MKYQIVFGLGLLGGSEVVIIYVFLIFLYIKVYRYDCATAAYFCY